MTTDHPENVRLKKVETPLAFRPLTGGLAPYKYRGVDIAGLHTFYSRHQPGTIVTNPAFYHILAKNIPYTPDRA